MAIIGRRRLIQWSLLGLPAAFLNACGQKGPLYLPDDGEDEKKKKKDKSAALGRPRSPRA
ncbi:MAG: lipoprotein [Gammaproteobacteria bacterium]|nr:lipoprotein [Gammaproteobacteria bacterium]